VRRTRIFRNLTYRWTLAGLGPEDIAIISLPSMLMLFVAPSLGISQVWTLVVFFGLGVTLAIFKRGKPPGYIESLLTSLIMPKVYSHKERDRILRPFPLTQSECSPSTKRASVTTTDTKETV
jgi:hypothetical protein